MYCTLRTTDGYKNCVVVRVHPTTKGVKGTALYKKNLPSNTCNIHNIEFVTNACLTIHFYTLNKATASNYNKLLQ